MATPFESIENVLKRFGIDPEDETAVARFMRDRIHQDVGEAERERILEMWDDTHNDDMTIIMDVGSEAEVPPALPSEAPAAGRTEAAFPNPTELMKTQFFAQGLHREFARSKRENTYPIALLVIALDKSVRLFTGKHSKRAELTAIVERVLTQQVRAGDFAGSAGNAKNGEYALTIYIAEGQNLSREELLERVESVANRLSRTFESETLEAGDESIPVKVWIGYETTFRAGIANEEDLIARATEAARLCAREGTQNIGCLPGDEA